MHVAVVLNLLCDNITDQKQAAICISKFLWLNALIFVFYRNHKIWHFNAVKSKNEKSGC